VPDIKGSVGDGGANAVQDVALVQAMLRVVKDAKGAAYFGNNYSGTYDGATKTAIAAFQADHKLIAPAGVKLDPAAAAKYDTSGLVGKNSQTLKELTKALPADYKEMRIIEGTKTVYLEMKDATAKANAGTIQTKNELDASFRQKVATLVTQVYADYKIALSIPPDGWRRDFAAQAKILPTKTGAGPGESNHQYGQAVDIGFQGLRWVDGDGQIRTDNWWLDAGNHMTAKKRLDFWAARNKIAYGALGLFKTNKVGDDIHVQAYSDNNVEYHVSLAGLLQSVSPKGMKWVGTPHSSQYKTDFGLGGATFKVGTARELWSSQATVTKADLATALNAKLAADKTFVIEKFLGLPPAPAQPGAKPPAPTVLKDADIKQTYIDAMKTLLQAEFKAADANWKKWKPLP